MPQGDKLGYTDKQKPQPDLIETGCEKKGFSAKTARRGSLAGESEHTTRHNCIASPGNKKEWLVVRFSCQPAIFALRFGNAH
jgi:hypothetical protein